MNKKVAQKYAITQDDVDMIHALIEMYGYEQAIRILTDGYTINKQL